VFERFTEKAINIISMAQKEAADSKTFKIYPEHILLGVLETKSNICSRLLAYGGMNADDFREYVYKKYSDVSHEFMHTNIAFSEGSQKLIKLASELAKKKNSYIMSEHILLALILTAESAKSELLQDFNRYGVDIEKLKQTLLKLIEKNNKKNEIHPELERKKDKSEYSTVQSIFKEGDAKDILERAVAKLTASHYEILGTEQIVQSILEDTNSDLTKLLNESGIDLEKYTGKLQEVSSRQAEFEEKQIIFTPNAFKTMLLAFETAKELGSASVKPEHIILGVLKAKSGIAYNIFKELHIQDDDLAHKIIKPIEKQMPETLTILRLAKREAQSMNRNIVGSEFILLGIIGEGAGIGAKVLSQLGITIKDARIEVEKVLGYGNSYTFGEVVFSDRAKKILEIAWEKAKKHKNTKIASENLLWAITQTPDSVAMQVLSNLGVDVLEVNQGILKELEELKSSEA
jgi:endopeptidase clp ATP-binding chain C